MAQTFVEREDPKASTVVAVAAAAADDHQTCDGDDDDEEAPPLSYVSSGDVDVTWFPLPSLRDGGRSLLLAVGDGSGQENYALPPKQQEGCGCEDDALPPEQQEGSGDQQLIDIAPKPKEGMLRRAMDWTSNLLTSKVGYFASSDSPNNSSNDGPVSINNCLHC